MLFKYAKSVEVSFDRIELSIAVIQLKPFFEILNTECMFQNIDPKDHNTEKYDVKQFRYKRSLLTVKIPKKKDKGPPHPNPRFFVSVSDPDEEIQQWLKSKCLEISEGILTGRYSVLIKEIEVAVDFFTDGEKEAEKIWRYIGRHFFTKGSRAKSYKPYKTTKYVGRNGYARDGTRGRRCYLKRIRGKPACRLEAQYNRQYVRQRQITCDNLPLEIETFPIFDNLMVLHDFANKGVRSYAQALLLKQGVAPSGPGYRAALVEKEKFVRWFALGGTRGSNPAVYKQIAKLKELNKQYGLAINYRTHFEQIKTDKELTVCLVEIGKQEDLCSKRLVMLVVA